MKIAAALLLVFGLGYYFGRFTAVMPQPTEGASSLQAVEPVPSPTAEALSQPEVKSARPKQEAAVAVAPAQSTPHPEDARPAEPVDRDDRDIEVDTGIRSRNPAPPGQPISVKNFFGENFDPRVIDRLEQRRRNNATNMISQSHPMTAANATARGLIGRFEGDILLDESTGRTWQIAMETSGSFSNNSFIGTSQIQLFRNGRPFVTSSSDGTLKNFRSTGNNSTVLVQINDSFYLDAIYDGASDSITGNFYGKNSQGQFRYRGPAFLVRRSGTLTSE